MITNTINKMHC